MNNYLPIGGSIIAVVLLVLGSLSNVVGYQSVKSTTLKDSPLFSIRTGKATNNENKGILTSNYLGKGVNIIQFPLRDDRKIQIQNVIQIIQKMDNKEYNIFTVQLLTYLQEHNNENIDKIINQIRLIRRNNIDINIDNNSNDGNYTWGIKFELTACWFPFKYLIQISIIIFVLVFFNLYIKITNTSRYTSCEQSCP